MSLAVNEQEFNSKKQQLASKLQECISKCQITSSCSLGGICIIWNDFFGSFIKGWLEGFRQQLQSQLNQLQNTTAANQKEIVQLEAELRSAEAKYNDNMTKAAQETDPAKKAQFIAIAQAAEREVKQLKQKIARNPLSKLAEYNHLHNLGNLIKGNLPPHPTAPVNCPHPNGSGGGSNGGSGGGGNNNSSRTPWSNNSNPTNSQSSNQTQFLLFAGVAVLILFYLMNQKEHEQTPL